MYEYLVYPRAPKRFQEETMNPILTKLYENYGKPRTALQYKDPFQLLVATILSAQCTDEMVNRVTPALFERYPTPQAMAEADMEELKSLIRPTGFFNQKAKTLQKAAQALVEKYGGEVPKTIKELTTLPGVARKTANVVLGNAFGIAEGIAVDTHVRRLAQRLGWSSQKNPEKIEEDLMMMFPQDTWIDLTHLLIEHGRAVCKARTPQCSACFLEDLCPKIGVS